MKIIRCDLCLKEVSEAIGIEVLDGEHPHNGSTMYSDIDCCLSCINKIRKFVNLRCNKEWADLKEIVKNA